MSPTERLKKGGEALNVAIPYLNIGVAIVVGVIAFTAKQELSKIKDLRESVHSLELFQAATEANRYTSGDRSRDAALDLGRDQDLQRQITKIDKALPATFPPPGTEKKIDSLIESVGEVQKTVTNNQLSIGRLEVEVKSMQTRFN